MVGRQNAHDQNPQLVASLAGQGMVGRQNQDRLVPFISESLAGQGMVGRQNQYDGLVRVNGV